MSKRIENILDRADTIIDSHLPQSAEAQERRRNRLLKPLGVFAAAVAMYGVAYGIGEAVDANLDHNDKQGQEYSHNNDTDTQNFQRDLDSGTVTLDR